MGGTLLVSDGVEARWSKELDSVAPSLPRQVGGPGGADLDFASIEVLYFSGDIFPHRTREFAIAALKADNLRWLHTFSAGVDDAFFQSLIERGVRITTSSGVHAVPIAQTVMMYLLALSRDLPGWLRDQSERRWNPRELRDLQGLRLGVVGLGPIGLAVARLGQAFGMEVIGLRRTPRGDEPCETWPIGRLGELLPNLDALVLAVPLSEETSGLIDASALALMRADAMLVNIARGDVVDEDALIDALRAGRLAGAGLDVFHEEPLCETSPLWSMPNVIITPHSSGTNPGSEGRVNQIFLENLGCYLRGNPMRNEVGVDEDR